MYLLLWTIQRIHRLIPKQQQKQHNIISKFSFHLNLIIRYTERLSIVVWKWPWIIKKIPIVNEKWCWWWCADDVLSNSVGDQWIK